MNGVKMFYQTNIDPVLRFGDVLKGFITTTPFIDDPLLKSIGNDYKIEVSLPKFSVIISPCCSIGPKLVSLTPLMEIRSSFFDNTYFAEDFTRINRKMKPEFALPSKVWESFSFNEKNIRNAIGLDYVFLYLFIYEKSDSLHPPYEIHRRGDNIKTSYYMIDFRYTYCINCDKIGNPGEQIKRNVLNSKILQLTIETRKELRDKLSNYFGRTPKEDEIEMD